MKLFQQVLLVAVLGLGQGVAQAADISVALGPDQTNPATPTMGNWMQFHSVIHNSGNAPVAGLVAWISLVEVTPGHEQPMDLEDWSAHKAVSGNHPRTRRLIAHGLADALDQGRGLPGGDQRYRPQSADRFYESDAAIPCRTQAGRGVRSHSAGRPWRALVIGAMMGYRGWRRRMPAHTRRAQ